jgi:RHS repeat-associated protein
VSVTDWLGHVWTFSWNGLGRPTGGTSPDGTSHSFAYDAYGSLTAWSVDGVAGRAILRDAEGRRLRDTVTAGPMPAAQLRRNAQNTFDAADRLVSATAAYGDARRPVRETFLYDGCGALTNIMCGGETVVEAAYDAHGRLALLGGPQAPAAGFSYDALGNRILFGGRMFIPDHSDPLKRPLVECEADGTPVRYYIWGPGRLLGFVDSAGVLTVAHSDEQGSVIALTDEEGGLLFRAAYSPHGEDWGSSGENPTPFAWLGGCGVMRAGGSPSSAAAFSPLYLTRHRLYSPVLRRFLSADPLGIDGGLNLYAYANGNPLAYIDPLGLCAAGGDAWTRIGGFFQMIGGGVEAALGFGLAVFTAETGVGIAAGVAVGMHGMDVYAAGYNTMMSGTRQDTLTSQGLQAVGVPQDWANGIDMGISMAGTMGVGAATKGASFSTSLIVNDIRTVPVSHWGTKEISSGSWVMKGTGSRMDYFWSGKWQPKWMPGKNLPAVYQDGNVYSVPPDTLRFPSGINWIKGFLGQRIYEGPIVMPSSPISIK